MTTAAPPIPKSSNELAEMLADDRRRGEILASRDSLREFIDGYATSRQAPGSDLDRAVETEVQRQLATFYRDRGVDPADESVRRLNLDPRNSGRQPGMMTSHRQGTAYNPRAAGARVDHLFDTPEDFLRTIWHMNPSESAVAAKLSELRTASVGTPSAGGYLVPERLRALLADIALEMAVTRPRATVVPMDSARVPFPAIDVSSHASSLYGGMVAYWGEEAAVLTESSPSFRRVVLEARKLTGLSYVSNELLQDSMVSFSSLIERLWPKVLAFEEDFAFMTGSGVGEPLGFIGANNPASIAQDAESGQVTGTVVFENVIKMYARMLPASLNTAIWIIAPNVLPQLYQLSLDVGTGGAPVFIMNASAGAPMTLLGRPIVVSEKASTVGTRGDIVFADLSYYLVGDRQEMAVTSSTDHRFSTDETAWRFIQRVDGRPWLTNAITPRNGGDTLSAFVELATR